MNLRSAFGLCDHHDRDADLSIIILTNTKRGTFASVADLKAKVLAFIAYFNRTMAKPFRWTYQGKALAV
jgi:hypothetical protein